MSLVSWFRARSLLQAVKELECGGGLTVRQQLLGLAVEHDVDAGEGSISQQRGSQPREQRPDSLRLVHVPQSPRHADVVETAALRNQDKHRRPTVIKIQIINASVP